MLRHKLTISGKAERTDESACSQPYAPGQSQVLVPCTELADALIVTGTERMMAKLGELDAEMDGLGDEARTILANPNLTVFQRRLALDDLLNRHEVLKQYKKGLAEFVSRMRIKRTDDTPSPYKVVAEILSSPEITALQFALLAALIAVIYADGPRAAWVPTVFMLVMRPSVPAFAR